MNPASVRVTVTFSAQRSRIAPPSLRASSLDPLQIDVLAALIAPLPPTEANER